MWQGIYHYIIEAPHELGWGQHATSKTSFIGCLDDSLLFDSLLFFQNGKSGFYAIRILTTYITKMQLHGPDVLGILQYISEWARTTDHPGCSHVLDLHSDLELKSASTDGRHLTCLSSITSTPSSDVK